MNNSQATCNCTPAMTTSDTTAKSACCESQCQCQPACECGEACDCASAD